MHTIGRQFLLDLLCFFMEARHGHSFIPVCLFCYLEMCEQWILTDYLDSVSTGAKGRINSFYI